MQTHQVRVWFVGILLLCGLVFHNETATAVPVTNTWKVGTGKWETAGNWSAGAPSTLDLADVITNATSKTVTIDATTTNSPATLTISNLLVSAPGVDVNTLQLTNAGTATPLIVRGAVEIDGGGVLLITKSSVVNTNALSQFMVGKTGPGQMIVSNGTLVAGLIYVGENSQGTMTSVNSTNTLGALSVAAGAGSTGAVWITGGLLTLTNGASDSAVGNTGIGQMTVSNGTVLCANFDIGRFSGAQGSLTVVGGSWQAGSVMVSDTGAPGLLTMLGGSWQATSLTVGSTPGSQGTLVVAGGTNILSAPLVIAGNVSATGAVWVTGGQLVDTNGAITIANNGAGQMTVSNGLFQTSNNLIIAGSATSQGTFTVAGGTNVLSATLAIGNAAGASGAVWVTGGRLVVTNGNVIVGNLGPAQMTVSNGTVLAGPVLLGPNGGHGTLVIAGGTTLVSGPMTIAYFPTTTGAVWVTGGQLTVTNGLTTIANAVESIGQMTVSNGTWLATNVVVGVVDTSQGTLTVAGGTSTIYGSLTLGNSDCGGSGMLVMDGGQLFVTNSAHTAVLDVRNGTVELNSGTLTIDQLVITNACGHFVHTGGTLIMNSPPLLGAGMDADGDGIPNGYEQAHGLDPLDPVNATRDTDGDGMTDLEEYLAGTDPTNAASVFKITSIVTTGNSVRVTWMTGAGKTNALEETAGNGTGSFATNNFAAIFSVTNTTGTVTNYLDTGGATNKPSRFYRVRLVP